MATQLQPVHFAGIPISLLDIARSFRDKKKLQSSGVGSVWLYWVTCYGTTYILLYAPSRDPARVKPLETRARE